MTGAVHERGPLRRFQRWAYRRGAPAAPAQVLNRLGVWLFGAGLSPRAWSVLEVRGRRSGRRISLPVAVAEHGGERYLVAMLGGEPNWVRNVRAADGRAVLRHGRAQPVRLVEVPVSERAPILREYLRVAPGARPHFAADRHAPLAEFERIAGRHAVFRLVPQR